MPIPSPAATTPSGSPFQTLTSCLAATSFSRLSCRNSPTKPSASPTSRPRQKAWPCYARCSPTSQYPSPLPSCIHAGAMSHGPTAATPIGHQLQRLRCTRTCVRTWAVCTLLARLRARAILASFTGPIMKAKMLRNESRE